jgi:NADH:ubiquinone oxidoreductase subunit H
LVLGSLSLTIKVIFLVFSFLWVRSSFPRIRYDQLMMLMWKGFLPLSIAFFVLYSVIILVFLGLPSYYSW